MMLCLGVGLMQGWGAQVKRRGFFQNPVLQHNFDRSEKHIKQLQKNTAYIMTLSDKEILRRMPVQTPRIHNACPNCQKGIRKRNPLWDYQEAPKSFGEVMKHHRVFDPRKPDQYVCPKCGEVYPNNSKYPQSKKEMMLNWAGEKIPIRYYEDPNGINYNNKADNSPFPRRYYLDGVLDTERHYWIRNQMYDLALLYRLTGNLQAGHRAMVILNAYADRWPHWLFLDEYGHNYGRLTSRNMNGSWSMTREGRRAGDETQGPLLYLQTVDLMMGTKAFKMFDRSIKANLADKLWDNVIGVVFNRQKKTMRYKDIMMFEFGQGCPTLYVKLARVFNRPRLIRDTTIKALPYTSRNVMCIDGGFIQGPGYQQIHLLAMREMFLANGYSDPRGFKLKRGEKPIKNYRYPQGPDEDYWMKAYNFFVRYRMPDGGVPVVNDSEHSPYLLFIPALQIPLKKSRDFIAHGLKYAILGDGDKDEQIQLHLNYSENKTNHGHYDTLTLQLFAFGHYLMDDSGYCKNTFRRFGTGTSGHNTVVIDQQSQSVGGMPYNEGNPLLFDGRAPGIKVISVDAARCYLKLGVKKYQRTLLMNTYDLKRPYIVDIFQVQGGTVRDYMLHSSYQAESTGKVSYALKKMAGLNPLKTDNPKSGYQFMYDVSEGSAEKDGVLDYVVKEPWVGKKQPKKRQPLSPFKYSPESYPGNPPVGTRHYIVGMPNQKAYFFGTPSIYQSLIKNRTGNRFEEWDRIPHFMLRQKVSNTNKETTFVVVHEPWVKDPKIKSVKKIPTGSSKLLALEVRYEDRVDTLFFSLTGKAESGKANGVRFSGRVGVYSLKKDGKSESYLLGGTRLERGKTKLTSNVDKVKGTIIRSFRKWNGDKFDAFTIKFSGKMPNLDSLKGAFAVVQNSGKITNLEKENFEHHGMLPRFYPDMKKSVLKHPEILKLMRTVGGGWGFVIDHVEKRGNVLAVFTKEDHGLDIKNGVTQEFTFPMREFKTPNTLTIYPSESSQRLPEVTPTTRAFMKPFNLTIKSPVPNQELFYAIESTGKDAEPIWHRYGKPILPEELYPQKKTKLVWKKYTQPISITKSTTLLVKARSATGIREQLPETYSYALPEKPASNTANLKPGLKRTVAPAKFRKFRGYYKNNRITYTSVAELKETGKISTKKPIITDVVTSLLPPPPITDSRLIKSQMEVTLTGFINVPQAGIYKIYFKAFNGGDLYLNGKHYIKGRYRGENIMPYSFSIPLKKGLLPIKLIYRGSFADTFEFEWITPTGQRSFIPSNLLFHKK